MTVSFTDQDLQNFSGTTEWYRHPMNSKFVYTEGVQYVGAHGCGWLLDIMALQPPALRKKLEKHPFQVWTLTSDEERNGTIVVTDGNNRKLYTKRLDFTDWPAGRKLEIWVEDGIALLPSEH